MTGPKPPPADLEEYDEDPEEDLIVDEWEDVDALDDENDDPRGDEQP